MNKGRWASIRVARGYPCAPQSMFQSFGLLALERNNSTQLTPASKAGLLVDGTVRKNWMACLEPRGFGQRQRKNDWYSRGVGHMGRRNAIRIWLFDQLKFRGRGETIPAVLHNSRDDLQRPLSNVGSRRVQCQLVRSQT
jgi:hypothetical protein